MCVVDKCFCTVTFSSPDERWTSEYAPTETGQQSLDLTIAFAAYSGTSVRPRTFYLSMRMKKMVDWRLLLCKFVGLGLRGGLRFARVQQRQRTSVEPTWPIQQL